MQINRDEITPELLDQMREVLFLGGIDYSELSDEEVVTRFEQLFMAVMQFSKTFHKLVVEPMILHIQAVSQLPITQTLMQLSEDPRLKIRE